MMMIKSIIAKLILMLLMTLGWWLVPGLATGILQAQQPVTLHLFYTDGCPHCRDEKDFLADIASDYPNLNVELYEVSKDRSAAVLMAAVGEALSAPTGGVPFTVIGDQFVIGFGNPETTGQQILQLIEQQASNPRPDVVMKVLSTSDTPDSSTIVPSVTQSPANNPNQEEGDNPESTATGEIVANEEGDSTTAGEETGSLPDDINKEKPTILDTSIEVPLLGVVSIKTLSLPALTILVAFLDGFNPCAMWVLLFLISLLIGMHDRKRMWILGTTFIIASGAVYFLFMIGWINFFSFLKSVGGDIFNITIFRLIQIVIGVFAIAVGIYQLRDFYVNRDGGCKVVASNKRKPWFDRMKKIVGQKQLFFAILGMIGLAAAVNVVELACSAGLPAIYTQVLALSNLASWQYYALLLLYITIFMIDDILIFVIAMTTLQVTGVQSKYARYSHLIGGVVILLLGLLLVFRPEWLLFG